MKRKHLFNCLLIIVCLALPLLSLAQGPPDPEDTPVDGGLTLLLAAGAAYGIKQYRHGKKMQESAPGMN